MYGHVTQHWKWASVAKSRGQGQFRMPLHSAWGPFPGSMLIKSGSTEESLLSLWHQWWQKKPFEEVSFWETCSESLWTFLLFSEAGLTPDTLVTGWKPSLLPILQIWCLKNLQRLIVSSFLCPPYELQVAYSNNLGTDRLVKPESPKINMQTKF